MSRDYSSLIEQAKTILERNWLGYATKPAPHLYPHQWSWDAAFIAIGYSHYDRPRAEQELRSLFTGQWANGMLPHIVFHPDSSAYFPGPDFWQTERSPHAPRTPRTSGIIQPPMHANAVWRIYRFGRDRRRVGEFLEEIYPRLRAWHDYLYTMRDPTGEGLVYIHHPWESGQDNSPIWDRALRRIELTPDMIPDYQRVDNTLIAVDDRPTGFDYDRYIYLVDLFRRHNFDEARIRETCPFMIQDVLVNTLLVQASRNLAEIARALGEDHRIIQERAEMTAARMNEKLWSEEQGMYLDYDLVAGELIPVQVAAGFTPLYARIPSRPRARKMMDRLDSAGFCMIKDKVCWPVPSFDRQSPDYSPRRYWRGPVWLNVNWLLYHGLRRYHFDEYAARVKEAILELPRLFGFYEYFSPETGEGHGAAEFSWTAALVIELLMREGPDGSR